MTTAELNADLALCSPFYADQFRERRIRWAQEDHTAAISDLKFYRAMKLEVLTDAKLNGCSYDNLLPVLDSEIAGCIKHISTVVMS